MTFHAVVKHYVQLVSLALVVVSGALLLIPNNAEAVSGSQWRAGNIMDDSVFFDPNTMSANEIQAFMNSKVPSCDTNGSQIYSGNQTRAQYGASVGYPPPFTCLKDYRENTPSKPVESGLCQGYGGGNKSSAEIVFDIAHSCGVNPQILLVLMQKEQSLVTDSWPFSKQLQRATAYACPDTAGCDSQYFGFFNQVYNAARIYKKYARDSSQYNYRAGRNNNIRYNPQVSCGSSAVYIENQATAGLYVYTPYQPNQAALDNLYGQGDACSAHGNRNFWRIFSDWFGPTNGILVRTASSGDLYYSDGTNKYRIGSMEIAREYGLSDASVRIVSQAVIDGLTLNTNPPYLTQIIKSTSDSDEDGGNLYLVTGGRRYTFPSMQMLTDYGFDSSQITHLPYTQILRLPNGGMLTNFAKSSHGGYIFKVQGGQKQAILDYSTFMLQNPSGNAQDVSSSVLDRLPTGNAIVNGYLVLRDPGGGIWLVIENVWHYVSSMETYSCLGLDSVANIAFTSYQTGIGTQGADAHCTVQLSNGSKYLMDSWRRIPIDSNWGFTNVFTPELDGFVTRHMVYSPTPHPVFRSRADAPLYTFEGGKKRQIYSMSAFHQKGYTANDIFTASTYFLSNIPTSSLVLADGTVVSDATNGKLYVIADNKKYYIPFMEMFYAYGFKPNNIVSLSPSDFTAYADGGTLSSQVAYAATATIFDSGIALRIPNSIEGAFGFNGSTPHYPEGVSYSGAVRQGTRYMKFGDSPVLYYMENGAKRAVYSWDTFVSLGGNANNITRLSADAANLFPDGPNM